MYIHIRVTPSAKRESLKIDEKGRFVISVREPSERGLANARVRELVASHHKVPLAAVRMLSGHQSPHKLFSIAGVEPR